MTIHPATVAADALTHADASPRLVVVTLCAAWCNTCTEFRASLEAVAASHADVAFVWLDIEDDAELCGDVDVESFPTLVAWRGNDVLHYGVTVPHGPVVARLVAELAQRRGPAANVPEAVHALRAALTGTSAG